MHSARLAERLKELRLSMGLTLHEIADLCGMRGGRAVVSKWERSENPQRPDDDILIQLADFYGVSLDYLYDRPDATYESPAVLAALKQLHSRLSASRETGLTTAERLAIAWRILSEVAPGVFDPRRVAIQLNLSDESFAALMAGQIEPDAGVVARFAKLVHVPESLLYGEVGQCETPG